MKKILRKLFRWIFSNEIETLEIKIKEVSMLQNSFEFQNRQLTRVLKNLENTVGNIDVSVDVHEAPYSKSWAVISIQGQCQDFIKFVDLGRADIEVIKRFLSQFDRSKIDATPQNTKFLKIK